MPVRERVPDEVVRAADEIELVDMSPHALRQRMRHGNVYPPDRAAIALERFFTEPNLTALRDLSLRFVAGQVDEELEGTVVARRASHLPPVTERVMALVDESPECRRALRRAASLASALHAPCSPSPWRRPASSSRATGGRTSRRTSTTPWTSARRSSGARRRDWPAAWRRSSPSTASPTWSWSTGPTAASAWAGLALADRLLDAVPGLEVHLVGEPAKTP